MTNAQREEYAVHLKQTSCNCGQAVLLAFRDQSPLDEEPLRQLASGFGGGMGCMQGNCGALAGAVMAAGLLCQGKNPGKYSREIYREFVKRSGAAICGELKGIGTGKELCSCDNCVRNAVRAVNHAFSL